MIDEATFKEQFPATWRAVMEDRRQQGLCELPRGRAIKPIGAGPAAMLETLEPTTTRTGCSLQLAITACDGDSIAIRIARDGNSFTATIDLDRPATLDRVEGETR